MRKILVGLLMVGVALTMSGCGKYQPQTWQETSAATCNVDVNWDAGYPYGFDDPDHPDLRWFVFDRSDGRFILVLGKLHIDPLTRESGYLDEGVVKCNEPNPYH